MAETKKRSKAGRQIIASHLSVVIGLSILTVLQSVLQVTMSLMSRFVIDAALSAQGNLALWAVALAANVLGVIGIHAWVQWLSGSATDKLSSRMRQDMLSTAVFSRDKVFLEHHSGALLNRAMEDIHTVCDGTVNVLPSLIGQITRLVGAFAAVVFISMPAAIALLAGAFLVGVMSAVLRPVLKEKHRLVRISDEKTMSTMQEDLQQMEVIQSLGVQKQIQKRFADKISENLRARRSRRIWAVGSGASLHGATQLGSNALLLWGAAKVATGSLSYGSLTALLQLLSLFRMPVMGLSGLWTRLSAVEIAAERLQGLLDKKQADVEELSADEITAVVFENVTFAYPGEELPVLQNFSFRFPLDHWTCMTGASGKGKTTVFKLILGLYTPQSGSIYLQTKQGNVPCSEKTRHLFAYVPQDYVMFSGSVVENMQLVDPDVKEEKLKRVFSVAQADFVWELADGLRTQVRENNAGLSKGQLQRLAIARAVLMDRRVFLLDECTSALDAETEAAVLQGLHVLGKQAMLVTHRPEAVRALGGVEQISLEQ